MTTQCRTFPFVEIPLYGSEYIFSQYVMHTLAIYTPFFFCISFFCSVLEAEYSERLSINHKYQKSTMSTKICVLLSTYVPSGCNVIEITQNN